MTQTYDMTINRLPVRTWNRLNMNGTVLRGLEGGQEGPVLDCVPEDIQSGGAKLSPLSTGMGGDMDTLLDGCRIPARRYLCPSGRADGAPLRLTFPAMRGARRLNRVEILAETGGELTVLMDLTDETDGDAPAGESGAASLLGLQTRILARKDARVRLVQVIRPGQADVCLNDVGVRCEAGARVQILQLVLRSTRLCLGCRGELLGEQSSLEADTGYLLRGDDRLDMNYEAVHLGAKTTSRMDVSGSLRDRAFKLFRGTIDFQKGASGASGDEKEDVLLLDDGVVNQTIPLILCSEEDVQGNHGATIGRLSGELLFYLQSRGISLADARELMARSRMDALCERIPDERLRQSVKNDLEGGERHENH
ncbi:MAG: SufD family Fe-S cluster assembly protein [Eubacteriales bacterium]|nr:SufD family Fe-S cluster assembly protein [Eubacteriales bacterium]